MNYLQIENISKRFGELLLFSDISFTIDKGNKVALIAKNGIGKTTLLNIITGIDSPDNGKITFRNNITIGYLKQEPKINNNKTVIEEVFSASKNIVKVIQEYEKALKNNNQKKLEETIEKMDFYKAWDYEVKIKTILSKLKINDLNQKIAELSGGEKKRLSIANLLINTPDLLILDEPTNHLDIEIIEWLEEYLQKNNSTLLMVTHDRYFLDRICNEIIEIDNNTVYKYKGNYDYFLQKRQERIQQQNTNAQRAKNIYQRELQWLRKMPKARTSKSKYRIENVKKLHERTTNTYHENNITIDIKTQRIGKKILELNNISKTYGNTKLITNFSYRFINGEKIGIIGKNGAGKTTFLNIIKQKIQPDTGAVSIGQTITIGYYEQTGISFAPNKHVINIIEDIAENIKLDSGKTLSASKFLEMFLFPPKTHYQKVQKLSGGEKKRLYLMTILMKNPNFLILDEPTNDLDIMTLNVLEEYLQNFNGCIIIVSHDRYFMDKTVDKLFIFEGNGKIKNYVGKYTNYYLQKKDEEKNTKEKTQKNTKKKTQKKEQERPKKMTFKQKELFYQLEKDINNLEKKITKLENLLNSGKLSAENIKEKAIEHQQTKDLLDKKELQWLELSEIEHK